MTEPWDETEPTREHHVRKADGMRQPRLQELELVQGPGAPKRFGLKGELWVIGRAPECDVRVDSSEVSRRHIRLVRKDDDVACEDLESKNGMFLNGVKVHSAVLRNEDRIQIGDVVFVYHEGG